MFSGAEIEEALGELGVTHVVMLPDSTIGEWEDALHGSSRITLVKVCREGEAWGVAAGLQLGGKTPVILIQCTGFFESGDALRNFVHDLGIPLFAIVGYRSYLNQDTLPGDTCLVFTEPLLDAWKLDWRLVDSPDKMQLLKEHYRESRKAGRAGVVVLAEGKA